MAYLPSRPDATLLDAFKATPTLARPLHDFAQQLMRGPSPFTPAQREMLAVRVSRANGCSFCERSHAAAAERLGVDADALRRATGEAPDGSPDAALRPVLAYVDKLNRAPASVNAADVRAVLDSGWNETALHHAALVCGFFNLMNRWVEGLGLDADADAAAAAGRMLADEGYEAINTLLAEPARP